MAPEEFLEFVRQQAGESPVAFLSSAPQVLQGFLTGSHYGAAPIETVSGVLAPVIGQLGVQRFRRGELVDALGLDANYIRRSDAELLWKGR